MKIISFVGIIFLSNINFLISEESFFSDSRGRKGWGNIGSKNEFSDHELLLQPSQFLSIYSDYSKDDAIPALRNFSEWKAVQEILLASRLHLPVKERAGKIFLACQVSEELNKNAFLVLSKRYLSQAFKNGEVNFISVVLRKNKEEFEKSIKQYKSERWEVLFESEGFAGELNDGPSPSIHFILLTYEKFLDHRGAKNKLPRSVESLISSWPTDPLKTRAIIERIRKR